MPGWRVHCFLDRVFYGKSYYKIHRKMDAPVLFFGRKHRMYFHDSLSAYVIGQKCYPNDPNAIAAANLHIYIDQLCSADSGLKMTFESWEIVGRRRGKKRKKQTPIENDILAKVVGDIQKIAEIRRMWSIMTGSS